MFESLFKPFNRPIRRGCLVYASPGLDKCLVTRCAFDDGMLIGLSNATEMVSFSDIDRLGLAIEAALLACSDNARSEPPRRKDTDGPSYKASGMRTLKSFKENYIPITFLAANDANIIYVANGPVLGSNDLGLRSSGTSAKDYGHMVHALVSGSEHMKP